MFTTSNTDEMVTISRAEYEELLQLREENAQLTKMNEWFREQITLAKHNRFSSKADTVSEDTYGQLSLLFDEAEVTAWMEAKLEKSPVAAHTRQRRSGALKDIIPEGLPVEVEEHRLEGKDLLCQVCGEQMVEIGKTVRQTLKFQPAQVIVHEDWYYTYACKACEDMTAQVQVVKTPRDASVLPGSFASPEAVAHIMTQKYVMGVPLYRQEQDLKRRNIGLSRQTMSNWVLKCSELWLTPLYEALHEKLKREEIIHADETTLQVLHEPGKKAQSTSYMWLYRTGKYAEYPIVLYEYKPDRRQENPAEFLGDFRGYLQTDGYSGYNSLKNAIHVGCLAHLHRKFTDAEKATGKGKASPTVVTALAYCGKLTVLEKQLADLSCEKRYTLRQEKVKPILDEFSAWVNTRNAASKSALGIALTYAKNQLPKIQNYLLDGRLEQTNNLAERSIKPFTIDRKNFLFANTPAGATGSAVTFSIIETAKENGLDPFKYLTYIFKTAPTLDRSQPDWILPLLPWNVPDIIRANNK